MTETILVQDLSKDQARAELARLAQLLLRANDQYHAKDAPEISDAEYDRLKRRNAEIELRFPELKRARQPLREGRCPPGRRVHQGHPCGCHDVVGQRL